MISDKALQQVLDGAQKEADQGPCFCVDPVCEDDHEDPDQYPSHAITFVKPDGQLDKADNKTYLGKPWGVDGPYNFVIDHPQTYPDDAPRLVIVDRATGEWCCATACL